MDCLLEEFMDCLKEIMDCKEISIEAKKELQPYFDLVDYEGCEYCFTTLYMWQHIYKTSYFIGNEFAIIMAEYEGNSFSILPLAKKEKLSKAVEFIVECFKHRKESIYFRGITKEVVDLLENKYPNRFKYTEERDLFDYIYDAKNLRTLKGRKNTKKRNHINYFIKEYDGRYEYKQLDETNFDECINLMKKWSENKEGDEDFEDTLNGEIVGMNKVFENYPKLKDKLRISGIYIDGKLEAFTMGEMLNESMAVIHTEKANPKIRGLYAYINQQFLVNDFSDAEFVNREDDLGIPGLRKAKLSYHPIRFVEKYTVREL